MLARYHIRRGVPAAELPEGIRQDTRKHTRHPLRPPAELVAAYLAGAQGWEAFADAYRRTIAARMTKDRAPYDALAALASREDVYLGCSCPTKRNPDVRRCHTWLALEIMRDAYPELEVRFP